LPLDGVIFNLFAFRIVSSPLVHQCAIAIARQLQLVWWRLAGPFLERVYDVHRFRERGDVEYAVFELRLNPDLSSRISQWPRLGGVLNYCTRPA